MIEYNNSTPLTKYSKILLHRFMSIVNSRLGSRTELNYHIMPVDNFKIKVPFYIYTNDEKKLSPLDFIKKRVNTLIEFLESVDWASCANLQEIWIIHSLKILGIDVSTDFTLSTFTDEIIGFEDLDQEPLKINYPNIHEPKIERVKLNDGSTIIYLSSPYLNDYGIFANLTVPFSEMGMSFNALHLYEHVMTCGWRNINSAKLKIMNGSTWPNGLCSVFAITNTLNSMKAFAASYIKHYLNSRDKGFWQTEWGAEQLKLETQRTISETRTERSLSKLCRSDYHAYDYRYNTDIFEYWSNKPLDILISGPVSLDYLHMNVDVINDYIKLHPIRQVEKPKNIIYHTLPLDAIKMKKLNGYRVVACKADEIRESLLHMDPANKSLYGLDNKMISEDEDLNSYNIILHVLVYNNKLFSDSELAKFVHTTIIPFSCAFFNDTSLCSKFAGDFLFDPAEDDPAMFQPYCDSKLESNKAKPNKHSSSTSSSEDEGDYTDYDVSISEYSSDDDEELSETEKAIRKSDPMAPINEPDNNDPLADGKEKQEPVNVGDEIVDDDNN